MNKLVEIFYKYKLYWRVRAFSKEELLKGGLPFEVNLVMYDFSPGSETLTFYRNLFRREDIEILVFNEPCISAVKMLCKAVKDYRRTLEAGREDMYQCDYSGYAKDSYGHTVRIA